MGYIRGGKVVVIGVGKFGYIGKKFLYMLQSLGIFVLFFYFIEVFYGDMGVIGVNDIFLFIIYFGCIFEFFIFVFYFDMVLLIIFFILYVRFEICLFFEEQYWLDVIFLFVLVKKEYIEVIVFGVVVLMILMIVVLVVGDVLVMVVVREIYGQDEVKSVFVKNYFGGVIGMLVRR